MAGSCVQRSMNPLSQRIALAIERTRTHLPAHWRGLLQSRCQGPAATGSVTDFTDPAALEEALLRTTWSPYEHPAVASGCVAFWTSEIPGTSGVIALDTLPPDALVTLRDAHATGLLDAEVEAARGPREAGTVLLLGEHEGAEVVFTFHPGPPLRLSSLPVSADPGRPLTRLEAQALGLAHAKVRASSA